MKIGFSFEGKMSKESKEQLKEKLSSILDIIICLILFIMSLYKGGFYKADTAFSNIAICSFGIIILIVKLIRNIKNNNMVTKNWMISTLDCLMIIMPVCYLMPILFRTYASIEGSITEFLTYLNFSIIYFIVRSTKNREYYIDTIIIIGVVLAILGIDELTSRTLENVFATISVSYVTEQTGRLAATLQYANVTALVILIATELVMYKLINTLEKKEYSEKYMIAIYTFILILLSSCTLLTGSRMASLLLLLAYLIVEIYLYMKKDKKGALIRLFISLPVSIILTSMVEKNINMKEYNKVAIMYLCLFVFIWAIEVTLREFVKKIFNKVKVIKIKRPSKKKVLICSLLSAVMTILVICLVYVPLDIKANDDEKQITGRNIYGSYVYGKNEIDITISENENADYNIYVYEVYEDFTRQCLCDKSDFKNEKNSDGSVSLTGEINVGKRIKNLRMSVTVKKGSIEIESLKINKKMVKLSYLLVPDSLVFKLKDTFVHDQNNELRNTYYNDSIKLIKLSPIIGLGGEGFLTRYQEVQDKTYISSEAHSSILQIGVETGILGIIIFASIILVSICIIFKTIKMEENKSFPIIMLITMITYIITSLFDISMSFQLLVLLLAVIVGLACSYYFERTRETNKDIYKMDNKSKLALVNICTLTTELVLTIFAAYYSYNVYKAGLINVEFASINAESEMQVSYTTVNLYEKKLLLDKYNVKYALKLNESYTNHIELLTKFNITETDKAKKRSVESEILQYTIRQKNVIDNLIEYDYYDKYALNDAAKCYFNNFMIYAKIYEKNFTTSEVAYAFYLGYAIKLTERINIVGPYNKVAQDMVLDIYEYYYNSLNKKNKYIKSEVIASVVKDLGLKLEIIKEKGNKYENNSR